jgi:hypothetical protein
MKQQIKDIILALAIWIIPGLVKAQQAYINLKYVDPLEKVFKETAFFPDKPAVAEVARGEYATFQFAFRSNVPIKDLSAAIQANTSKDAFIGRNASVGYVGYVWVGRPLPHPPADKLSSVSGFYPDPILDTVPAVLPPDCTQPIWITVKIPKGIKAGQYTARLLVKGKALGKSFSRLADFHIHVYPVTIDSTSLWITQWYDTSPLALGLMNKGKTVPSYSPRYWELLSVIAHTMADYHQNVVLISPLQLTQYQLKNGKYDFDFSRFDKTVEVFKKAGALKRIEGGHIGGRMGGWDSQIGVSVPLINSDTTVFEKRLITDQLARDFYEQFIPALVNHLKAKGWYTIYMQHIADEPTDVNYGSYMQVASFIKKLAPAIPFIDACHTHKIKADVWVPQLDFLHKDYKFYQQQQQEGSKVWFYTCMWPEGEYASRFIEVPLLKTRIMHWINFRYGIPGYLYWSFNPGRHGPHPFAETTDQNDQEGGGILPAGDSYIVYPGYGKLYSSIRLEAMRDGIYDYELLKMLAQKQPEEARDICRRVVIDFNVYDTEIKSFRGKRKQILELLSKQK